MSTRNLMNEEETKDRKDEELLDNPSEQRSQNEIPKQPRNMDRFQTIVKESKGKKLITQNLKKSDTFSTRKENSHTNSKKEQISSVSKKDVRPGQASSVYDDEDSIRLKPSSEGEEAVEVNDMAKMAHLHLLNADIPKIEATPAIKRYDINQHKFKKILEKPEVMKDLKKIKPEELQSEKINIKKEIKPEIVEIKKEPEIAELAPNILLQTKENVEKQQTTKIKHNEDGDYEPLVSESSRNLTPFQERLIDDSIGEINRSETNRSVKQIAEQKKFEVDISRRRSHQKGTVLDTQKQQDTFELYKPTAENGLEGENKYELLNFSEHSIFYKNGFFQK